jgi:hypothetical protein
VSSVPVVLASSKVLTVVTVEWVVKSASIVRFRFATRLLGE